MKNRAKLYIAFVVLGMVSCGSTEKGDNVQVEKTTIAPETDAKELYLYEGKKWIANNTTVDGIHEMISLHEEYNIVNSPKDAAILASELNAVLDGIFNACDMEGEAHNQLHIFLVPLIHSIDALGDATTEDKAKQKYDEVLKNLLVFDTFFKKA